MKELKWNYDEITAYWANRVTLPLLPNPQKQFEGSPLVENSWKKHIINNSFPEYCHYPYKSGYLLCSPSNIIKCFENDKVLEALVLTIGWGAMTRTKGKNIYTRPNKKIEEILLKCTKLIKGKNSVMDSWNLLVNELKWSAVITSKCLHFLVRSLGYEINPPVPIDNAVIIKKIWPKFKELIKGQRVSTDPSICEEWRSYDASWDAYNRYMTAINCWSKIKGWTTTQIENTIFKDFLGKKNDTEFLQYFPLENLATNVSNKFVSDKPKAYRQDNRTNTENRHHQFFVQLLEQCNKKTKLFSTISPTNLHYVYASAGTSGLQWGLVIYKDKGSICLRLSLNDKNLNWNRCKILESNKRQIEEAFGKQLRYDFSEGRKEQFIYSDTEIGGLNNDENWSEIQIDMVDHLIKLEKVLRSYLDKLP